MDEDRLQTAVDLHYRLLHLGEWEDCRDGFCQRRMEWLGLGDTSGAEDEGYIWATSEHGAEGES